MKITAIESIALDIPFNHGGPSNALGGQEWNVFSTLLVKVETDEGITGYGDAFAYHCRHAVQAVIDKMIAPMAVDFSPGLDCPTSIAPVIPLL